MKAMVYYTYGSPDVLSLKEVATPVPAAHEVLVKVYAASVNAGDWHLLRADPLMVRFMSGLMKPKYPILGIDIAGRVEAVGSKVGKFKPGDEVIGDLSKCGFGAFAQYSCASEEALVLKPAKLSYEEAATLPTAAVTALQGLRDKGQLQPGQQVLINGASGGVGSFAVQLAKLFGAEVTAVCSTGKVDMLRQIGADRVIDYKKEDFTVAGKGENSARYDLILDAAAYRPLTDYQRIMSPKGKYVLVGGSIAHLLKLMILGPLLSRKEGQQYITLMMQPKQQDLAYVTALMEADSIKPFIDRSYALSELPEAIRHLEEGRARGKVVIRV